MVWSLNPIGPVVWNKKKSFQPLSYNLWLCIKRKSEKSSFTPSQGIKSIKKVEMMKMMILWSKCWYTRVWVSIRPIIQNSFYLLYIQSLLSELFIDKPTFPISYHLISFSILSIYIDYIYILSSFWIYNLYNISPEKDIFILFCFVSNLIDLTALFVSWT